MSSQQNKVYDAKEAEKKSHRWTDSVLSVWNFSFSQKSILLLVLERSRSNFSFDQSISTLHINVLLAQTKMDRRADNAMCAVCAPSANAAHHSTIHTAHFFFFFHFSFIDFYSAVSYYRRNIPLIVPFIFTLYTIFDSIPKHWRTDERFGTNTSHTRSHSTTHYCRPCNKNCENNNNLSKPIYLFFLSALHEKWHIIWISLDGGQNELYFILQSLLLFNEMLWCACALDSKNAPPPSIYCTISSEWR